ncbi:MAG: hypothetical protein HYZ28_17045 [Myxococcales bacterium]|nr:hypothetical protein [Myxococcales bacterium]
MNAEVSAQPGLQARSLRVEGTFDRRAALELRELLEGLSDAEVELDFSRVREMQDLAVHILTRGLVRPSLRLRGLARRHERLFRYLGLLPPHPEGAAPGEEPPVA